VICLYFSKNLGLLFCSVLELLKALLSSDQPTVNKIITLPKLFHVVLMHDSCTKYYAPTYEHFEQVLVLCFAFLLEPVSLFHGLNFAA